MDDNKVIEEVSHYADPHLQMDTADKIVLWSDDNHMQINGKKSNEWSSVLKQYVQSFHP